MIRRIRRLLEVIAPPAPVIPIDPLVVVAGDPLRPRVLVRRSQAWKWDGWQS